MAMLTCKEVLANLSDYIDEEGSAELRPAIEDHISWCRRCSLVFDTTEKASEDRSGCRALRGASCCERSVVHAA